MYFIYDRIKSQFAIDMAMSISYDAFERYMKCPICMDWLKEPKMLPCLHTVCGACIWDVFQNRPNETNECPCPVCRQNFILDTCGMTRSEIDELRGMKNQLAEMQVQMEYYEKTLGNKSIRLKEDKEKSKNQIKILYQRMESELHVDHKEKNLVKELDFEYQKENQRYIDEISKVRAQIKETNDLINIKLKFYNKPESPDTLNVSQLQKYFSRLSKNKLNDSTHEKFRELRFVTNHNTANLFCRDLGHVRLSVQENASQHRSFQQRRTSDLRSSSRNSYDQNTRGTSPFEFLSGRVSPSTDSSIGLSSGASYRLSWDFSE